MTRLARLAAHFLPALREPRQVISGGPAAGLAVGRAPANGGYIVAPWYDNVFFIFSPLIVLVLSVALSFTVLGRAEFEFQGEKNDLMAWFLGPFIMAHLVAVAYRSHLNGAVFRRFPLRFTMVPLALFLAMGFSTTALVTVSVAATFWDVYHSGMQTFGLGRIYDARAGNNPHLGRRLDAAFNLLIYAGPIAAGATLMDHVGDFNEFEQIGAFFFTRIPVQAEGASGALMWAVIAFGVAIRKRTSSFKRGSITPQSTFEWSG